MTRSARARLWPILLASGVALVALGLIVKIADSVRENDSVVRGDNRIADFLIEHRTPFFTIVARIVTQLGSGWVALPVALVGVIALARARRTRAALVLALSTAGAAVLVAVAKQAVGRPRPPVVDRLVTAHGRAFPSGHVAQSVACYGALAWLAWELGGTRRVRVVSFIFAASIAFAVGVSRVYLGVHWPSDVISGWLLGIGWLAALVGGTLALSAGSAHRPARPEETTRQPASEP